MRAGNRGKDRVNGRAEAKQGRRRDPQTGEKKGKEEKDTERNILMGKDIQKKHKQKRKEFQNFAVRMNSCYQFLSVPFEILVSRLTSIRLVTLILKNLCLKWTDILVFL